MVVLLFSLLALFSEAYSSCEPGTVNSLNQEFCYGAIETHMTFAEAKEQCGEYGTYVASIHNGKDNNRLKALFDGMFWLGGTIQSGKWQWTDGSAFNYSNWMAGAGKHVPGKDCVAVDAITGLWIPMACNVKISFTCQFAQLPGTADPVAPTADPKCPSGALCIDGFGYSIAAPYFFDWPTAEKYCVDMFSGHLASIHSEKEYETVYKFLHNYPRANTFFIGGSVNSNGTVEWSDGTAYDYQHMMATPTSSPPSKAQCLTFGWLDLDKGTVDGWSFFPCQFDTEIGALCKYPIS